MKRADAEAIQIKGTQSDEKGDNKRADAEAIKTKGLQSDEKGRQ